ncbi:hypothetical protein CPTC_02222 [Corynebacterium pseudotuberculosis]|nr:Hypothetical protein Cp3995_1667 [Corynebacterium pseudotuberculosis 3/99-5]AIG08052.1 hypothetical protein CPTA_02223 [Corynebacterium pseudotuberculosis]AIG12510.1 hypothetical protein CPTC_02222 [Corynebacterium pseudotuberculosis]
MWIAHGELSPNSVAASWRIFMACLVEKPARRRALVLYDTCVSAQAVNASKEALIMSHAEPEHNGEVAVLRQLPGGEAWS